LAEALIVNFFLGAGLAGTGPPRFAAQRFFWAAEINARAAALIVRFFGAAATAAR
jgi:hypothetical protein